MHGRPFDWRHASNRLRNPRAVGGIGLGTIADVALLDMFGGPADLASRVFEQRLALSGVHLAKQIAWLLIVVVIDPMIPVGCPIARSLKTVPSDGSSWSGPRINSSCREGFLCSAVIGPFGGRCILRKYLAMQRS